MKTSENGKSLIKSFEGIELNAYRDSTGVLTIGYGHTSGVKEDDKITKTKAEKLFEEDLLPCEKAVEKWSNKKYFFNQNEFDALVSFTFNLGTLNLDKLINNGKRNRGEISDKMLLYYNAGGKKLTGLVKRRKKERELFLTPVGANTSKTNEEIAKEVIQGLWSNGAERRQLLTASGYDYKAIQSIVNTMLK